MREKVKQLNHEAQLTIDSLERDQKYKDVHELDNEMNILHDKACASKQTLQDLNSTTQVAYIDLQWLDYFTDIEIPQLKQQNPTLSDIEKAQ